MEYLFIFTYSVILAVMAGLLLGAVVAIFSSKAKLKKFQLTLGYTSLIVTLLINLYIFLANN